MKLTDLKPAWLSPDVFIFRSPAGYGDWLTCKRVPMTRNDQYELIYEKHPEYKGQIVVLTVPKFAWTFQGNDFNTLTVTPSIDASASGNWHGFITNGEIR
ncbi:MAG: DUF6527 family protein [Nitrospirota bacterium]|nr:DUF6527 family protein [Nitrospirota bacterium]